MTVDTAARNTLRVLHEKGKRRFGAFFGRNSTFFPLIGVVYGQYSDEIFARFQKNQRVPKKYPLAADAHVTRLKPPSRGCPSESLRVPECPQRPADRPSCVLTELPSRASPLATTSRVIGCLNQ
jgi:hypothetical protein